MLVRKVAAAAGGSLRNKAVAVWGLTFKANTDDVRDAPAIPLVTALLDAGAEVRVFDPEGLDAIKAVWPSRVVCAASAAAAARGAEILVVMTEWDAFIRADMALTCSQMARPVLVDMRNIYAADRMRQLGFEYHRIGKAPHCADADRLRPVNGHAQDRSPRDGTSRGPAREVATISLS
jgi:UDPglucose 6-dehydrogenase